MVPARCPPRISPVRPRPPQPLRRRLPPAPQPVGKTAASRVVAVTVYPNSALVTRDVVVPEGRGLAELTVTPLPVTTEQSSLYAEGSDGVRVLSTRFRTRPVMEDTREDVRKLQDELKQLARQQEKFDTDIRSIQAVQQYLLKMETSATTSTAHLTDKGRLDSDAAIALSKYLIETKVEKAREMTELQHKVQDIQEKAEFARRKLAELTSSPSRTEHDAVIVIDKANAAPSRVRLNYLVAGASWRPQYKLRAAPSPTCKQGEKDAVQLEYLAALSQQTGEDWSGVRLVLSTAQPMLNAAPPDLLALNITTAPRGSQAAVHAAASELEMQVKNLRGRGQKDFNEKRASSGANLFNTAAALDQSWELLNPEAALKRGCNLAFKEGPSVTYHLNTTLNVPSRNDEQVIEVTRLELAPDYYYKAVPVLTPHVYRLADLTNNSKYVLLPGEATTYIGTDFVGQMNLPLVAIGEQFTAGFGVEPQLQVTRMMTDKSRTLQGGNQILNFLYQIRVSNFKQEKVKVQLWDRIPHPDNDSVGVSLLKTSLEVSKDPGYQREQKPNNLLRWDVQIDPKKTGENALAINYEFKVELERQMTLSNLATASAPVMPVGKTEHLAAHPVAPPMTSGEEAKIKMHMSKLSPEDRKLAETQVFCAIDQDSRLGSMGPILKEVVKGRPVFICCKGCATEVRSNPDEALKMLDKLMAKVKPAQPQGRGR